VAAFRDDATSEHTERVGGMVRRIATRLGFSEPEAQLMGAAAVLHDIGKVAVPDTILFKPGRLTSEETARMREHTVIGAAALTGSASPLLRMCEEIAYCHHERWDGQGYPRGLAGEAIPLAARIVAVVDVADALAHDRPYRRAWPASDVLAEVARGRGTHFDPRVVDAYLETAETRPSVAEPARSTRTHDIPDAWIAG
jgi:putative two-component system response regulator